MEVWEVAWEVWGDMEVENKHNTVSNHHSLQRLSVMLSLTSEDMVPVMDNLAASVVQEVDLCLEVDPCLEVDQDQGLDQALDQDLDLDQDPDQEAGQEVALEVALEADQEVAQEVALEVALAVV